MRILALCVLMACGSEYEFESTDAGGSAMASALDATAGVRQDMFELGPDARTPRVDYLFVVDNSASMRTILPQLTRSFEALATRPEVFGDRARVGVMSTLPADPDFPEAVHPTVEPIPAVEFDPGFGGLVDRQRLAQFRQVARPRERQRMPMPGCEAWFSPDQKHRRGHSCLAAHLQVALQPMGVEAGVVAFSQLLERPDFSFRTGASVHVIFVSDTHDPGLPPHHIEDREELLALHRTAEELETLARKRFHVSNFQVHALAPMRQCTQENWSGLEPVYHQLAEATGGVRTDLCATLDLTSMLATIAETSKHIRHPVMALSADAEAILDVRQDGMSLDYAWTGEVLELDRRPSTNTPVEVTYRSPLSSPVRSTPRKPTRYRDR